MQLRQIIIKISGHLVGRKNSVDNKGRVLRISGRFCNSVCLRLRSWFSYFFKKKSLSLTILISCLVVAHWWQFVSTPRQGVEKSSISVPHPLSHLILNTCTQLLVQAVCDASCSLTCRYELCHHLISRVSSESSSTWKENGTEFHYQVWSQIWDVTFSRHVHLISNQKW